MIAKRWNRRERLLLCSAFKSLHPGWITACTSQMWGCDFNNTQNLCPSFCNAKPKRCKTQFDGCWKNTKCGCEASRGPNNGYHLLPLRWQCESSLESSDPESLETCQGDLLSCIEKTADKESVESQRGQLFLLCGCGWWEHWGMANSLSV